MNSNASDSPTPQSPLQQALSGLRFNSKFSFAEASEDANSAAYDHLKAHMESKGAQFHGLTLKTQTNGYRGVFAAESFKETQEIISIPLNATLQMTPNAELRIPNDPLLNHKQRMFDIDSATKQDLYDFIKAQPGQELHNYDPYLHLLPNNFSESPFFFNQHFLDHTGFGRHVQNLTLALKYDYLELTSNDKTNVPIDIFFWNYMSLQSRFFNFKNNLYLVPMLDLMNHSNERLNCKFKFDKNTETIRLFTLRDIQQGEELLFSYNIKMCPMRSLIFYSMFPEDKIIQEQKLVYFYDGMNKYGFGVESPAELARLISSTTPIPNLSACQHLAYMFGAHIQMREETEQKSLALAQSPWEEKVIRFIYQQEVTEYKKLKRCLEALNALETDLDIPIITQTYNES